MTPLFTAAYRYTPELIHAFCRIHLWYHRRQHPLFLKTPGIFLAGCLLWRLFILLRRGAGISFGDGLTLALIGLFTFVMVWMGFVHPRVFERTLRKNLDGPSGGEITLSFFDDRDQADSPLSQAEFGYGQIQECYLTAGCVYLYVNGDQALLVPFESLKGQDARAFQLFLKEKLPGTFRTKMHLAR